MKDYRYIEKPWGHEEIWAEEDIYVGKFLYIKDGHSLSRQYHNYKRETITVLNGSLLVEIGFPVTESFQLVNGKTFTIIPGCIHRFIAAYGNVRVIEVSTNHLDDVVRLEDNYSRSS